MHAVAQSRSYTLADESRGRAQLAALVAIGLVAVSGGLLSEMNRKAQPAAPAVLAPQR